ncbi:MAG: 16S rRNA (guanine(966)-N(2))-methyltransferase RsmD [Clostridiales bacterium]|nr:16S rRNA (guanine(966)-N(2))-methyltransferase RsmD [Clostridiales bacterium]
MHIISGNAKGRKILTLDGENTRPTQGRVRESLFSILYPHIQKARILDLFAGSGSLALEGLSRGAESAVAVDAQKRAIEIIKKNRTALGFASQMKILHLSWEKALFQLKKQGDLFELIFVDPPYEMADQEKIFQGLVSYRLLAPKGMIVYEHGSRQEEPVIKELIAFDRRKYGDTWLTFYRWKEELF